ncbi:hypothetical protein CBOM_08140 [Ceraceosorus bombacis]|uniref:Uncharacterized protein n=1 Tax=Ceraceosorus bombacis TaxID=401625 RepID=A0A0P1B7M3_9BASI|nr:hypothetical protein CBOM_08140 [Ceraceosorus bombacis]
MGHGWEGRESVDRANEAERPLPGLRVDRKHLDGAKIAIGLDCSLFGPARAKYLFKTPFQISPYRHLLRLFSSVHV